MVESAPVEATLVAMVGLPARGKTFIANKLLRYLQWKGHRCRLFNVGSYRRKHLGRDKSHTFFDFDNEQNRAARNAVAELALEDALAWLSSPTGGEIALYDATNITALRRTMLRRGCDRAGVNIVFIETVCENPEIIEANIKTAKLHSPDYEGWDPAEAARDFRMRIAHYRRAYEPLTDASSFIRLEGPGDRVIVNRTGGWLATRAVPLLMSLRPHQPPIWLTRHGESTHNVAGRIGGDAPLSPRGRAFARRLGDHVRGLTPRPSRILTSTLRRTRQTAEIAELESTPRRDLEEIDAGVCDGMTYAEIREQMPELFAARQVDKLRYRYPRGESYLDLIARLDTLVLDIERRDGPLLIIGHQAVLRAIYAYLAGHPADACPFLEIPLHTVIELRERLGNLQEERRPLT